MKNVSSSSRRTALAVVVAFVLGGGVFGSLVKASELQARRQAAVVAGVSGSEGSRDEGQGPEVGSSSADPGDLPGKLTAVFVDLAEKVTPGVVQVEVRRPGKAPVSNILQIPGPFRRFFDLPDDMEVPPAPNSEEMAGGTGFVISPDGYVLTNAHVVNNADRIVVNLVDRTSHEAKLVGSDVTTDLAVIKIEGQGLSTLSWGSSGDLQVGEPVMAVGNPGFSGSQSLDYTVTTGIVSAVGRPLSIIRQSLRENPDLAGYAIENFIQTDAVINPGNSGGPLVDLWGRVVGVNSAIASSDGHYQGYGFAIPADLAKKVASELMEHGRFVRGWLGVSVTPVSSEDAEVYRLPRVIGVLVQDVSEDGPAQKSGLEVEDVILAVNGNAVQDAGDLQELVAELGPGARAELELYRSGKRELVSVRLGEVPFDSHPEVSPASVGEPPESLLGMTVDDLTRELASELGFDHSGGAVITRVVPWSSAMRKGIVPGMKLKAVDHTPIRSAREFRQAIGGLEAGDVVTMELETPDGGSRIVNLRADNH